MRDKLYEIRGDNPKDLIIIRKIKEIRKENLELIRYKTKLSDRENKITKVN